MFSIGGLTLTRENRNTEGKPCPSATLSTTNHMLTGLGLNPVLCIVRPVATFLSHGMAFILLQGTYLKQSSSSYTSYTQSAQLCCLYSLFGL